MAEKIRYTRRDLKGPDEFISTFGRVVRWCKGNRPKIVTGILVVLAVSVLVLGTDAYFRWQERKAEAEIWPYLEQVQEMMSAQQTTGLNSLEKPIESLVTKYSGTGAAMYARYHLGSIAFHSGDYAKSATRFREAIESGKDKGVLKYLLRRSLAASLEATGNYAEAASSYREAAKFGGQWMKAQAQFDEGRVLELSGKKVEAAAVYRKIIEENPESPQKILIDVKLVRMETSR